MNNIKELANRIDSLEDQLMVCMRCGMCQSVCPLFAETGREADVARGKLALLDGLSKEMFDDPKGVSERLDKCLLCGSCAANCPSGVSVLEIFIEARAILAESMGLSPVKKAVLRGMLSHPRLFDRLLETGAKLQNIFVKSADDVVGTSCARFVSPILEDRRFKPLAKTPFHRTTPSLDTDGSGLRVGFFVGCIIDKIFPNVARASVSALENRGVGIYMPPGQACCGIPAISSGDVKSFERLVLHNLDLFNSGKFDYLATSCATCTSTIKKVWPMMMRKHARAGEIARLSAKTMDITQFLVKKAGVGRMDKSGIDRDIAITYHDPCHLKKSLGVFSEPRDLIRTNPSYRLREMAEPDRCCGMGGSFNLRHYDISRSIGEKKRDAIAGTGCSVVAAGCPACMLQLSDMLSRAGDRITVKHPVEIYAETISMS